MEHMGSWTGLLVGGIPGILPQVSKGIGHKASKSRIIQPVNLLRMCEMKHKFVDDAVDPDCPAD